MRKITFQKISGGRSSNESESKGTDPRKPGVKALQRGCDPRAGSLEWAGKAALEKEAGHWGLAESMYM